MVDFVPCSIQHDEFREYLLSDSIVFVLICFTLSIQEGKTAYDIAVAEGKNEAAQLLRVRLCAFMSSNALVGLSRLHRASERMRQAVSCIVLLLHMSANVSSLLFGLSRRLAAALCADVEISTRRYLNPVK